LVTKFSSKNLLHSAQKMPQKNCSLFSKLTAPNMLESVPVLEVEAVYV